MKTLGISSLLLGFTLCIGPASADVGKILSGVSVKPITAEASKGLKAKGALADYYGYYGMQYAYYGYIYGYYGYVYQNSSYYYSGYASSSAATTLLYYAYYYQATGQ
jgi:hypothetical protein